MAEQDARGALAVAYQEGFLEGFAEGIAKARAEEHRSGLVEAKRDALFRLLARRGLSLTDDMRARISACTDLATLDRWVDSALTVGTVGDVLS